VLVPKFLPDQFDSCFAAKVDSLKPALRVLTADKAQAASANQAESEVVVFNSPGVGQYFH
jgi:hypothetical protein